MRAPSSHPSRNPRHIPDCPIWFILLSSPPPLLPCPVQSICHPAIRSQLRSKSDLAILLSSLQWLPAAKGPERSSQGSLHLSTSPAHALLPTQPSHPTTLNCVWSRQAGSSHPALSTLFMNMPAPGPTSQLQLTLPHPSRLSSNV